MRVAIMVALATLNSLVVVLMGRRLMYCSKIGAQKRDYEKQITQLLYKEVIASPPRLDTNLTRVSITECHLPLCSDCSVEDYKKRLL